MLVGAGRWVRGGGWVVRREFVCHPTVRSAMMAVHNDIFTKELKDKPKHVQQKNRTVEGTS